MSHNVVFFEVFSLKIYLICFYYVLIFHETFLPVNGENNSLR